MSNPDSTKTICWPRSRIILLLISVFILGLCIDALLVEKIRGRSSVRLAVENIQIAHQEWVRKGPVSASGGRFFTPRLELPVPLFRQNDPVWGKDLLGPAPDETIGSHGCAVASAAMILASYGVQTNPQALNDFLKANEGFTPEAWLKWEKAAELDPARARFVYEDLPSYQLIDENLSRGNPVIVRLRYGNGGTTHFVVICGKDGYDYLTCDPGKGAEKGVYPLKEFGSDIEALRFYERVRNIGFQ